MPLLLNFGTAQSLFNKGEILDLTAYLLLRSSETQSLQQIADKIIESGGSATASSSENGMSIQISAKKKFEEFFQYVLMCSINRPLSRVQFDLIKGQSLSALDRPYTEPNMVAGLTMSARPRFISRVTFAIILNLNWQKQIQAATREHVVALYQQFFNTHHAQIAVTGEFNPKSVRVLKNNFASWKASSLMSA